MSEYATHCASAYCSFESIKWWNCVFCFSQFDSFCQTINEKAAKARTNGDVSPFAFLISLQIKDRNLR